MSKNITPDTKNKEQLLFEAVSTGKKPAVLKLLKEGANPNHQEEGQSLLDLAIKKNSLFAVMQLLKNKVDINLLNKEGWAPLHIALQMKNFEIVEALLKNNADKTIVSKNDDKKSPICLMNELLCELTRSKASLNDVIKAIEIGADVNCINEQGDSPLQLALNNKDITLVSILRERGAECTNEINELLLQASSIEEVTRFKAIGGDISYTGSEGWSLLHKAFLNEDIKLAEFLFNSGAKLFPSLNSEKKTPADIINQKELIHKMVFENNFSDTKFLIEAEANINLFNKQGYTPLFLAFKQNNIKIIDLLITKGANKDLSYLDGHNPNDLIAKVLCDEILGNASYKTIIHLIKMGAKLDYINDQGWTPLHLALQKREIEIVKLLVNAGADKYKISSNDEKQKPIDLISQILFEAIQKNHSTVEIKELIDMGADVNYISPSGWTPLHLAFQKGRIELAKLLIENKADINQVSKNSEQTTPLEIMHNNKYVLEDIINNKPLVSQKKLLFFYQGNDTAKFLTLTPDPKQNLFHPENLKQYFDVKLFTNFKDMLSSIASLAANNSLINVVLDVHGFPTYPYQLTTDYDPENASEILELIIKASNGKPIKLLSYACFGANLHDCNASLEQKMPNGSLLITLSKKGRITEARDKCDIDMYHILEVLQRNNEGCPLKVEQLLEAYCISQRFVKNTPVISTFHDKKQQIISLKEYFNQNIIENTAIKISETFKDLLAIKGFSEEELCSLLEELRNSTDPKFKKSLFRTPSDISDIKNAFKYLEDNKLDELVKIYSKYFTGNNVSVEGSIIKELYEKNIKDNFSSEEYRVKIKHCTPAMYDKRFNANAENWDTGFKINYTPKHSILLAYAAEQFFDQLQQVEVLGKDPSDE